MRADDPVSTPSDPLPTGATALSAPGLHNLIAVGTNLFSGSSPEGRMGFESLVRLGVRTIITVDGTTPDVQTAHELGLRYVHLPHGYDGIGVDTQRMLAKAGRELDRPIYVHCHHGRHRGPVAAAVISMADEGRSREWAEAFVKAAGTSSNYAGLYQTIREFNAPSDEELASLPDDFPESAKVSGLVEAMVEIDERWEHLKAVRNAGYLPPADHPDIVPANETVILWESYREAQRLPEVTEQGPDMTARFREAEAVARETEQLLRAFTSNDPSVSRLELDRAFEAMNQSCSSCHQKYRNVARTSSSNP